MGRRDEYRYFSSSREVNIVNGVFVPSNAAINPISHEVKQDPPSHGGGVYYDHGLKQIFPDRFLALSLHISIVLYIRTSHAKGIVSSFKTLDLRAFQKLSPKTQKNVVSKFIKEKLKKLRGPFTSDGRRTKPGA